MKMVGSFPRGDGKFKYGSNPSCGALHDGTVGILKGEKVLSCRSVLFIYSTLSRSRMVLSVIKSKLCYKVVFCFGTEGRHFDAASIEIPHDVTWS